MANKIIQLKDGNDNVYLAPPVDYIVEQGTSGIWTYRKWASGIAECWGIYSTTLDISASWGNVFYREFQSPAYPFTFVSNTTCHISSERTSSGDFWIGTGAPTDTRVRPQGVMCIRGTAMTIPVSIHYQAKGLWKTLSDVGGGNT